MQKITAIGFDMDYTLSEYIPQTFETLAYEVGTSQALFSSTLCLALVWCPLRKLETRENTEPA